MFIKIFLILVLFYGRKRIRYETRKLRALHGTANAEIEEMLMGVKEERELTSTELLEKQKMVGEYLKHLTTISAGAIVLVTTFLDKIFENPLHKESVIYALGFLTASIVITAFYFVILLITFARTGKEQSLTIKFFGGIFLISIWITFVSGLGFLSYFTVENLKTYDKSKTGSSSKICCNIQKDNSNTGN